MVILMTLTSFLPTCLVLLCGICWVMQFAQGEERSEEQRNDQIRDYIQRLLAGEPSSVRPYNQTPLD
jgi:hypothetical protein